MRLENGIPYATDFADIYHSADGAGEVQRVFIQPSGLAAVGLADDPLWVGELGFGSGLNFAVLAEQCIRQRRRLHFVSCDAAPLSPQDFSRVAAGRTAELSIYQALDRAYPPLISGWHRRYLADGLITLSLHWGDAQTALNHLARQESRPFRAWFLDGFAPDRNPQMWSEALLSLVGRLSAAQTTVATFTAAGRVRRGLQAAGFEMRRVDQRPHKRESLAGFYKGESVPNAAAPSRAVVLGAGLAGASVARQLAQRDVQVSVLEAGPAPASGASGIAVSMLHPRLLANASDEARLRCHAYLYSAAFVASFVAEPPDFTGALQLPGKNATEARLQAIAGHYQDSGGWLAPLNQPEAEQFTGWTLNSGGLWFPQSQPIDMSALCRRLLDHPNIELRCNAPVQALADADEVPVVLACAAACRDFPPASYLELAAVQGQIDIVRPGALPKAAMLGNGYVVPWGDKLALGSTYEYSPWENGRATRENLAQLPVGQRSNIRWLERSRGTRCVSSDRLPIVGAIYDRDQRAIANLFVSTAMGSMGNVFSHYAGELLASQICGEFPPATRELQAALSSLRFRQRQERRGHRLDSRP
jgi:tRNA 5-methylaminomethyl-2-thiouridine biosynthesis bifunctional protein